VWRATVACVLGATRGRDVRPDLTPVPPDPVRTGPGVSRGTPHHLARHTAASVCLHSQVLYAHHTVFLRVKFLLKYILTKHNTNLNLFYITNYVYGNTMYTFKDMTLCIFYHLFFIY